MPRQSDYVEAARKAIQDIVDAFTDEDLVEPLEDLRDFIEGEIDDAEYRMAAAEDAHAYAEDRLDELDNDFDLDDECDATEQDLC